MMQIRIMRKAGVMARIQWRGGTVLSRATATAGSGKIGWTGARSSLGRGNLGGEAMSGDRLRGGGRIRRPRAASPFSARRSKRAQAWPARAMGPAMLRTAGIVRSLRELGHDVEDRGDLRLRLPSSTPPPPKARRTGSPTCRPGRGSSRARPTRLRGPGGRRSCSAATTASRWARSAAWRGMPPRRDASCSCFGWTPIRTSTRR